MAPRPNFSESQTLEQFRVALENVEDQLQIANIMAEFGYDGPLISEGKALWQTANTAYLGNKTEKKEKGKAYDHFTALRKELQSTYGLHRQKAKIIFRKDPLSLKDLGISGPQPSAYINWFEMIKEFYSVTNADADIQTKFARLKITVDDLAAANTLVSNLETARTTYLREKGESQDATKVKDQALVLLDDWMSEFYAVAAIALAEHPQLLESLNKHVKS